MTGSRSFPLPQPELSCSPVPISSHSEEGRGEFYEDKTDLIAVSLVAAYGNRTSLVYLCFYTMLLLPRDLGRACASHTDELCMAAMDPEGTGYNKPSPSLAWLASIVVVLPLLFLWDERLTSKNPNIRQGSAAYTSLHLSHTLE